MNIKKLLEVANSYPTILDIDQEIYLIEKIQNLDVEDIKQHRNDFIAVLSKIQESHNDSGIFEVTKDNENIFIGFSKWIINMEKKLNIDISRFADGLDLSAKDIANAMSK